MKKILLLSSVLSLILLILACNKEEQQAVEELKAVFEYQEDGVSYSLSSPVAEWQGDFLVIKSKFSSKVILYLESCDKGIYELSRNSFSEALYYPVSSQKGFSTNIFEEKAGSIVITDYNQKDSLISGTFEFVATYPSDQNDKREITQGVFENLKIERVAYHALEGRVSSTINGRQLRFRDVYTFEHENSISAIATHPSGPVIHIMIPRSCTTGTYSIPESELGPTDEVGILYQNDCNALFKNKPTSESHMIFTKVDFDNRSISGELSVTLSDFQEETVELENLTFELNWVEKVIGK
ncbi:MAG: hypothetical protein JEZ03_01135 [Bacteroidales bacterium]|nr:hypothetical protein [Bacteroidales bacterium]